MRKLLSLLFIILLNLAVRAAIPEIIPTIRTFPGGNNISCHGASDGRIEIAVVNGAQPYFYSWSNGSYSQDLNNVPAGTYTVTVTDINGQTATATYELFEPYLLQVVLNPVMLDGGVNISETGGNNGIINSDISGGTPDYTLLWSNGTEDGVATHLVAGAYALTVTDRNGCLNSASTTLIEPTPLHVVSITSPQHNGYSITCYGLDNGAINLSVAGGIPPYTYTWNNGFTEPNINGLHHGHYSVVIFDANRAATTAQIDVTEPPDFRMTSITPSVYQNNKNTSCNSCSNGSLTALASGGVTPITYQWTGGPSTAIYSGLVGGTYSVIATDHNNCTTNGNGSIVAPDRDDWSMTGNVGSNPPTQFIGTADNKDFVFKTNGTERLRIKSTGSIETVSPLKISGALTNDYNSVFVDHTGLLRLDPNPGGTSCLIEVPQPWLFDNCSNPQHIVLRQPFTSNANVGIGTLDPTEKLSLGQEFVFHDGGNKVLARNFHYDGLDKRIINGFSSAIYFTNSGSINLVTSGTGAANSQISWNTGLSIDNSGRVGLHGYPNPLYDINLSGTTYCSNLTTGNLTVNSSLDVNGSYLTLGKNDGGFQGSSLLNRALVHGLTDDDLIINENGDFEGGVIIRGGSTVAKVLRIQDVFDNNKTNFEVNGAGEIFGRSMKLTLGLLPDYVFDPSYELLSLKDLENYITKNKHLPNIISADEARLDGYVDIGELQTQLLKKVEELTLYLIDLSSKYEALKTQIEK